jgi:predicted SAM-dependent methyltransferase
VISRRAFARARNTLTRIAHRLPPGTLTPLVPNDLFRAHQSLFEFFAAFAAGRHALVIGDQPLAADEIRRRGAAGVDTRPQRDAYDVIVMLSSVPLERLAPQGILLTTAPPAGRFAVVRRFAHITSAELDLASPFPSTLSAGNFSFSEIPLDAPTPPRTLTLVYLATNDPKWADLQLHVGSGPATLPGWINIDNQPYPGVDFLWDLSRGIPFRDVKYVFAEHFLEHLSYEQGAQFVRSCRAVLRENGTLRLSTPNLDWVWFTSYHPEVWTNVDQALRDCFVINRAFRGWGHQFLYNIATLTAQLENGGFAAVQPFRYGESDNAALAGLERHEQYPDSPTLPHVLVVQAHGRATPSEVRGAADIAEYVRDTAVR